MTIPEKKKGKGIVMEPIPMYDFPREYAINRESYLALFDTVCRTGQFSDGQFSHAFERDFAAYTGAPFAASVSNGTGALVLSLRALGIGPGDEVIVPSATFTATPGAVLMCGAKPVFADIEPDTWQISVADAEKRINKKTKAVIGVHLYGGMFDVEAMRRLCDAYGLPFIEDTAQAVGSEWKGRKAGTFGKTGCFSFYPTKNLGAFGEAGCVVSGDESLIARINALKAHDSRDGSFRELGYNMRMDGLQGAVLSFKLKQLDAFTERKNAIASLYRESVKESGRLVCQYAPPHVRHSYHLFVLKTDDRERFIAAMTEKGIGTGVQYRTPCHRQKVFTDAVGETSLPVTEELMAKCVSVPTYPYLTDEEVAFVAEQLKRYAR